MRWANNKFTKPKRNGKYLIWLENNIGYSTFTTGIWENNAWHYYCSFSPHEITHWCSPDNPKQRKTGIGKECPKCGDTMISITTIDKRVCSCGYEEPFKLKPGQKSILEKGKIGK